MLTYEESLQKKGAFLKVRHPRAEVYNLLLLPAALLLFI